MIDGFAASDGVIGDCFKGVLAPAPEQQPRPFEIIFETPAHAPLDHQVEAAQAALIAILTEYRGFMAWGQNI
jgi:murein peptide amidase A